MNARGLATEVLPPLVVSILLHLLSFALVDWLKPECGDGEVQLLREECDDGNMRPHDGCSPQCELEPVCGDGKIEGEEECDDANTRDGDGCSSTCVLELEIREIEPPPPEDEPEPEPEPEPEVEPPPPPPPEVEPPPPPPPKKKVPKEKEPPPPPPDAPPPPPAIELPMDQVITGGGSGVTVIGGSTTRAGEAGGTREGKARGVKGGTGKTEGAVGEKPTPVPGPAWAPKGELYIADFPRATKKVKLECPAVLELGIAGTVVLKVQVRKDGSVRSVKLVERMGHGCDEVAVKALKQTKFKPAVATDGKPVDYEITRYTYEFRAPR